MKGEYTCASTVNSGILCVQLSVGDPSLRLDGRTGVSGHNSVGLRASTTTPATTTGACLEAKGLANLKV
jgi:hypothetical protein